MLRIRELRVEHDLTQKELAEKISSTSKNIWAYENNIAIPPLDVLIKLANFFQCSIDYIANREDDFGNVVVQAQNPAENTFDGLSAREQKLIEQFRFLKEGYKVLAEKQLKMIVDYQKEEPVASSSNAFTTIKNTKK